MTEQTRSLAGLPLLEDLPSVSGRRVLVRTDFNVPLEEADGRTVVADDFRIRVALPTIEWLQQQGASVTAASHLGRPSGAPDDRWRMDPVRRCLEQLAPGVELLENLRFSPGEKNNDPRFAEELVQGFDAYVNEAFGVCHRRQASVVGPPRLVPSAAGRRVAREVEVLGALLDRPTRPFVAVVGGAKVGDKLGALESLAGKVDVLCVGGAMAFTFLAAMGHEVGSSLLDLERLEDCRQLLRSSTKVILPVDVVALEPDGVVCPQPEDLTPGACKTLGTDIPDGWRGLDIGPETAAAFVEAINGAGTVLWNGPLGVVEDDRFAHGTRRVAEAVAACAGFTVVGGGDSARALEQLGLTDRVDFLSTGGGASLEFVEADGELPGLEALRQAQNAPGTPRANPSR